MQTLDRALIDIGAYRPGLILAFGRGKKPRSQMPAQVWGRCFPLRL
jgi:hypothetical protein